MLSYFFYMKYTVYKFKIPVQYLFCKYVVHIFLASSSRYIFYRTPAPGPGTVLMIPGTFPATVLRYGYPVQYG